MYFDFYLNDEYYPQNIRIIPEYEDPDRLHELVMQLPEIMNPSLIFSNDTHMGVYDDVSDEDFSAMLHAIKQVSTFWHDPKKNDNRSSISVFELLIKLFEAYIKNTMSEYSRSKLHNFDQGGDHK